jgi:hypothetical protein
LLQASATNPSHLAVFQSAPNSNLSHPSPLVIPTEVEGSAVFPSAPNSNLSHPSPLVIPTEVEGSAVRRAVLSNLPQQSLPEKCSTLLSMKINLIGSTNTPDRAAAGTGQA